MHDGGGATPAFAINIERPDLEADSVCLEGFLSYSASMDVLKMEQSIEQSLSKAMVGLCDQVSHPLINKIKVREGRLQRAAEDFENTVPTLEVPSDKGQKQPALQQQQQQQHNNDVSSLRMEVETFRQELRKISGQASFSADLEEVINAVSNKVCRDMHILFNALQSRTSSEVCDAIGLWQKELSFVKADIARTSECLQHVDSEVRSLRARSANEQFTGRLTAVEEEVQRNSKSLSHVGNILKVTHEITAFPDKMIKRMGHEVSNWRDAENRLQQRVSSIEQMLHQLGSSAVQHAEQHYRVQKAHKAEHVQEGEPQSSADLRMNLEALLGEMNETLQAPQPDRTNFLPAGFQQQSPTGTYTRAHSSSVLDAGTGIPGGMPVVVKSATGPVTANPRQKITASNPASDVQRRMRRSALVATSGDKDVASAVGPTTSVVGTTSVMGNSLFPRQATLSIMPVATGRWAQQPH